MSDEKPPLLDVAGDLDMSVDGSQCRIEIGSADGTPLTAQIILDAVTDMLMHYYSMSAEDWETTPTDELDS